MGKTFLAISNHSFMMGGGEFSFLDLIGHLPKKWNPIAVVPEERELANKLRELRIQTRVISLPPIRPWRISKIMRSFRNYIRLCRNTEANLIYANGSRAALYSVLIGKILRLPVIWHCRISNQDPYLDFLLSRLSSRIIVNSQATAKRFSPNYENKVRVVYNGINFNWLKEPQVGKPWQIENDWKIILVVGRLSRWKRHDLALSTFERIAEKDEKLHLVCVGGTDLYDEAWTKMLFKKTRNSAYSDRIHWVGQVDDIRPWYRAANIFLSVADNEAFGRGIVEAMALGIPVIASASGAIPEIIRHGESGILISHQHPGKIGNAILWLLRNEDLRMRVSSASKVRASEFSLDAHVKSMEEIFENTLKN